MQLIETPLPGCYVVELNKLEDHRGFFARAWCKEIFESQGLCCDFIQSNVSFSKEIDTCRGLHFQNAPYQEDKLIRCTRGSLYDVALDLRPNSTTLGQWFAVELSETNHRMLYIPKGFAHGFQTLEANTEIFYWVTAPYTPQAEAGIRWDDPTFNIQWPPTKVPRILSDKDKQWPLYGDIRRQNNQ